MSRKKGLNAALPLGVAALISAAVLLGLLIPGAFSAAQSGRIDRTNELVDLGAGALSLNSDDMKLEKLRLISTAVEREESSASVEAVGLSGGRFMTAESVTAMLPEVTALTEGTGLNCGDIGLEDAQQAWPYLLMSSADAYMGASIVWTAVFSRSTEDDYQMLTYLVDDSTGIIIAASYECGSYDGLQSFDISQADYSQTISRLAENLAASYSFTDTELAAQNLNEAQDFYIGVYYIDFIHDGQLALELPVSIGINRWSINI